MSICDNTTVNQETTLKLQSIRKTKTCRNPCKKTFNDPKIRRNIAAFYKKKYCGTGTRYQVTTVPVLKKYRGTFLHGTSHLCKYTVIASIEVSYDTHIRMLNIFA